MARLSSQIEELEEEAAMYRAQCAKLEESLDRANNEIDDLNDQLCDLTVQLEWIHKIHPELEDAYDAKLRLDSAA